MVVFDEEKARVVVEVVYDGPAYAGKTTNLEQLCTFFTRHRRSELYTTKNAGDRTVFLDWLELEGGLVCGRKLRCQLVTVPGQAVLSRRRWHLLRRADCIVFVVDSTPAGLVEGKNMFDVVRAFGASPERQLPLVVQANKQDAPGALPLAAVAEALGVSPELVVGAQANRGIGVRETAVLAIRAVADRVQRRILSEGLNVLVGTASSGPEVQAQMLFEEQASPQGPLSIVLEHAAAAETETEVLARPARRDGSAPEPPLPEHSIASGFIWPAATGRELLARVPLAAAVRGEPVAVRRPTLDSTTSGTLIYRAGDWCLKTSSRRCFAGTESARDELVLLARRKIALGPMLLDDTVLALQQDQSGNLWLWTVTPWLTTLEGVMRDAQRQQAVSELERALVAYAEAAIESLKLAVRENVQLDVHPSNFVRRGVRTYYVDDDILAGEQVPSIGSALLRPVEQFASCPPAVEAYVSQLVHGLTREFTHSESRLLGIKQALDNTIVGTVLGQTARRRLVEAASS